MRPDLVWRLMRATDREVIVQAARDAGIYQDPEGIVEAWYRDPLAWPLVLEWRGRVLQFEVLHFPQHGEPLDVIGGFIRHLFGDRSHWFWRESERPVWERLVALGCERFAGRVRSDRPDWAERLKELYGGQEVGRAVNGAWVKLEYSVARALAACTGWPRRRTLGSGWCWVGDGAVVREASAEDLPALRAWMTEAWAANVARGELALRLLDERWELDQAAVLIAFRDDVPVAARAIRERGATLSGQTHLGPLGPVSDAAIAKGATVWQLAVGYERASTFIPQAEGRHPAVRAHRGRIGASVRRDAARGDATELEWDLRARATELGL